MRRAKPPRRAASITLPIALLADARGVDIDPSRAADEACRRRWRMENAAAIADWNAHVAAHGLPLAAFRGF